MGHIVFSARGDGKKVFDVTDNYYILNIPVKGDICSYFILMTLFRHSQRFICATYFLNFPDFKIYYTNECLMMKCKELIYHLFTSINVTTLYFTPIHCSFHCIFSSSGMSSVDAKACGRIGLRAFCYYMLTSLIAGTTGIIMTVSIQPGKSSSITSTSSGVAGQPVESADAFLDLIRFVL